MTMWFGKTPENPKGIFRFHVDFLAKRLRNDKTSRRIYGNGHSDEFGRFR